MPRNVEIKARVADPDRIRKVAAQLADGPGELIVQEDIYFQTANGRLKLRVFGDGSGELIHYLRPDRQGPKTSNYALAPVADAAALARVLTAALPTRGTVRKRRTLFMAGRTRIHLDSVETLGHFLELEVVLRPGEELAGGEAEAERLLADLEITTPELEARGYMDLLEDLSR